ncbi:hypothetical protein C8Q70DRAFT_1051058 [Cubamyces menziesii]|nr:hypothetical protein C8Q70DRAFT_1051058 [Cubamyces menziesii]
MFSEYVVDLYSDLDADCDALFGNQDTFRSDNPCWASEFSSPSTSAPNDPSPEALPLDAPDHTTQHEGVYPHNENELKLAYLDEHTLGSPSLSSQTTVYSQGTRGDALLCNDYNPDPLTFPSRYSSNATRAQTPPRCVDPTRVCTLSFSNYRFVIEDEDEEEKPEPELPPAVPAPFDPLQMYRSVDDYTRAFSPSSFSGTEPPSTPSTYFSSVPPSPAPSFSLSPSPLVTPATSIASLPSPCSLAADDASCDSEWVEDDGDDEWVPTRGITHSKRGRKKASRPSPYPASPALLSSASSSSSARDSFSPSPTWAAEAVSGLLVVSQRRNIQVPLPSPQASSSGTASSSASASSAASTPAFSSPSLSSPSSSQPPSSSTRTNKWKCPHCNYEQRNHRKPDLARHVRSHTASAPGNIARWVCCGVPLASAAAVAFLAQPPPPPPSPSELAKMSTGERRKAEREAADERRRQEGWVYDGTPMVGGCRRAFSRSDALGRHLANSVRCVGDRRAPWLIGNKEEKEEREGNGKGKGKGKGKKGEDAAGRE